MDQNKEKKKLKEDGLGRPAVSPVHFEEGYTHGQQLSPCLHAFSASSDDSLVQGGDDTEQFMRFYLQKLFDTSSPLPDELVGSWMITTVAAYPFMKFFALTCLGSAVKQSSKAKEAIGGSSRHGHHSRTKTRAPARASQGKEFTPYDYSANPSMNTLGRRLIL